LIFSAFISLLLLLGVFGGLRLGFCLFQLRPNRKKQHLAAEMGKLNDPGQSILIQINQIKKDLKITLIFLMLLAPLLFAAHMAYSFFGNVPESWTRTTVSMGGGFGLLAYYLFKMVRLRSRQGRLTQRYEGEMVVARALHQMIEKGYQVYHEFPADGFQIDHLLIGPTGVMAVETKTVSRSNVRGNRKPEAIVKYDGRMLHFPKYSDHECIDQAKHLAVWLSQWISSALGQDICARAMVAVPGWSVKRTSSDGIPVVNPNQFKTLFEHIQPRPLSDNAKKRIIMEVEHQCRHATVPHGKHYSHRCKSRRGYGQGRRQPTGSH
jgi:hypothetical protein